MRLARGPAHKVSSVIGAENLNRKVGASLTCYRKLAIGGLHARPRDFETKRFSLFPVRQDLDGMARGIDESQEWQADENKNCRANCRSAPSVLKQLKNNRGHSTVSHQSGPYPERSVYGIGGSSVCFQECKGFVSLFTDGSGKGVEAGPKLW